MNPIHHEIPELARGPLSAAGAVRLDHLDWLESEAIYILREVAGQCANPVLLFSGGKAANERYRPGVVHARAAA